MNQATHSHDLRDLPCYLLYRGWRRAQGFYAEALGTRLNPQRMYVLDELVSRGRQRPAHVGELGELLAVDPGTISGLLSRMERDGLIKRERNPDNGHQMRVTLTREGRRHHGRAADRIRALDEQLLARIKPRDIAVMQRCVAAFEDLEQER